MVEVQVPDLTFTLEALVIKSEVVEDVRGKVVDREAVRAEDPVEVEDPAVAEDNPSANYLR